MNQSNLSQPETYVSNLPARGALGFPWGVLPAFERIRLAGAHLNRNSRLPFPNKISNFESYVSGCLRLWYK